MERRRKRRNDATDLSHRADIVDRQREQDGTDSTTWLAANGDAIRSYNERIAEYGVFSDAWRQF